MIRRLITNTILKDNSEKDLRTWMRSKLRDGSDEGLFPKDNQSLQNKHTTVFLSWRWQGQADMFPVWMSEFLVIWLICAYCTRSGPFWPRHTDHKPERLSESHLESCELFCRTARCIHASLNAAQNWLDMPRQQSSNLMSVSETVHWIFHALVSASVFMCMCIMCGGVGVAWVRMS